MPKFIHAADLHVDSPLVGLSAYEGAPVERIREAPRAAVRNLVKLAKEERASFVVIAGDVYDTNPLLATSLFFRQQMQELSDAGIPVVIVLGNHDHAGVAPKNLGLPEGVVVLPSSGPESHPLAAAGAVVHGQSYPTFDCEEDLAERYPAPVPGMLNVGLLHTGLGGLDPQHPNYAPTSPAALAAHGYQYWALGHVHKRTSLSDGKVFIEFPGNVQGRHARETGPKGALVVEYEGSKVLSADPRPLDVMRWHHLALDAGEAEAGKVASFVEREILRRTAEDRGSGRLCAVRVSLGGAFRGPRSAFPAADDLREALLGGLQKAGNLIWLEKVLVTSRPESADRPLLESALASLASRLAASESERAELASSLGEVKRDIRNRHRDLLEDRELARLFDGLDAAAAEAVLERALAVVGRSLR